MAIMRLERLGKLKIFNVIGNRNRDLPACSIVPQPTILTDGYLSVCFKETNVIIVISSSSVEFNIV
jgi:hypothetical protein